MENEENVAYNKAYDFAKLMVKCYQDIAGIPDLGLDNIGNLAIPLPPIREQDSISN